MRGREFQEEAAVVTTQDGVRIALTHMRHGFDQAIIIAHGFYNNKDTVLFKEFSRRIADSFDVVSFDLRGHGKSNGWFSWSAREAHDLRAVVAYVKQQGYARIGVIGFSLGAAVALIEAADNNDINSVIAISAPEDFYKINYRFWTKDMFEDLKLNMGVKGRGKGVRPGNIFLRKIRPVDAVAHIKDKPVLFLHGEQDWLISPSHSRHLFERAQGKKALKIIPGGGHAERLFDVFPEEIVRICVQWMEETLNQGRCDDEKH